MQLEFVLFDCNALQIFISSMSATEALEKGVKYVQT